MKDKVKRDTIKNMLRKEYGFPVFQRFLAELVYETKRYNNDSIYERYEKVLKVILGEPKRTIEKIGNEDDEASLRRLMEFMGPAYKLPKTRAAETVAKELTFPGYRYGISEPDSSYLEDQKILNEIEKHKKRLLRKLESKGKSHLDKKHFTHHLQTMIDERPEDNFKEAELVKSFFSYWSQKYDS